MHETSVSSDDEGKNRRDRHYQSKQFGRTIKKCKLFLIIGNVVKINWICCALENKLVFNRAGFTYSLKESVTTDPGAQ